ncbi:hypothetical protein [Gluconobacter roseus]|uniref:Uncharacterized protein n=1 Tax=Gluconobacter roseus NBRC 3990 TaxID=1307950 RepID=A0A4Y3M3P0_9PROT|nr:hypothetical protein [Gluconobacter roseus]KXV43090.1 hypothetical protein AD943_08885 [Gluconobacter roseus]GBR43268.1 hypothetical protein AA3990_0368 [Gluconobacter roseus NBRC 3990]GEB03902.1 hypothetical protein GRO01_14780 [Gluconobacter roseus NBRC 3990]GLP94355.1 hypothetical protein GCM10007871_23330 [Gluconobacter roseus NBRC 3990]
MADFLLVYPVHKRGGEEAILLPVSEVGPAFPVMSNGDMQGIGSWLHVAEYIQPSGRMLVHGTPLEIAEAIASDGRVAALTPKEQSADEVGA